MANITDLERFKRRWLAKTGEEMPHNISDLSIELVELAVELTEKGDTVFVPRGHVPVLMAETSDDSLQEWDKHGELT